MQINSTLKKEAAYPSETVVTIRKTTRCHNQENHNMWLSYSATAVLVQYSDIPDVVNSVSFSHVTIFSTFAFVFVYDNIATKKESYRSAHMAVPEQFSLFLKFTQTHFSSSSAHSSNLFFFSLLIYCSPCLMGVL
jgi:hypothetical protein